MTPKKASRNDSSEIFPARTKTEGSKNITTAEFVRNKVTLDKLNHPYHVEEYSLIMNKM